MIGVHVTVPVACFRKGLAREYLETERIPPPSTCYGFLLSLVGETNRERHIGVRVTPLLIGEPSRSVVLRTTWRVKKKPLGSSGNTRPDYQQILSGIELVIWLDSSEEERPEKPTLEARVTEALDPTRRGKIHRFGGLSLGESTHLVDTVSLLTETLRSELQPRDKQLYRLKDEGLLGLPVWVDHVGSAGTVHAVGALQEIDTLEPPSPEVMPRIMPN